MTKIKRTKQWATGNEHIYTWSDSQVLYVYYKQQGTSTTKELDRIHSGHDRYDATEDVPCPNNWILA
jgi:hypothetical protein